MATPCTARDPSGDVDPGSPYPLVGGVAARTAQTIASAGSKSWAVGLHTFTVWDVTSNKATAVVKTFKVCVQGRGVVLTFLRSARRARDDEDGFHGHRGDDRDGDPARRARHGVRTLVSLTKSRTASQRLVSNEQNVRFELDQLAREVRASNPLVPLPNATSAADYGNQIEMVLGPTGGSQTVVRWTYDTTAEEMVRQVMCEHSGAATVVSQSFFLTRVRNVETGTPVFALLRAARRGSHRAIADPTAATKHDAANCAVRVHIELTSDSNPGPLPFTETQDVEIRNRLPGMVECQTWG